MSQTVEAEYYLPIYKFQAILHDDQHEVRVSDVACVFGILLVIAEAWRLFHGLGRTLS